MARPQIAVPPTVAALVCLLLVSLAGCLTQDGADTTPAPHSLQYAPEWRVGDWWTYDMAANVYGLNDTFTVVVAAITPDGYLLGMPDDNFSDLAMIFHMPGLGRVARDLSWEAHDYPLQVTQFPLDAQKVWSTYFWGPNTHDVHVVDAAQSTATMRIGTDDTGVTWRYNATVGNLDRMRFHSTAESERIVLNLIDYGRGHKGTVRVPVEHDLVLYHGRDNMVQPQGPERGPLEVGAAGPGSAPVVPPGYDAMTFALILTSGSGPDGAPLPKGYATLDVTDPQDTAYHAEFTPLDGAPRQMQLYHFGDPTGTWTVDVNMAGTGHAILEGIAYTEQRFTLL